MTKTSNRISNSTFSEKSLKLLDATDEKLKTTAVEVRKESRIRFEITESLRSLETQQKYFKDGKSQIDGIIKKSKHQPRESDGKSEAVDIVCYHPKTNKITWEQKYYYYVAGLFEAKALELNISINWGGWWNFEDCVHFELCI